MDLLRKLFVVATVGISLPVLFYSGWLILALSFNSYPVGALLLLPWTLGLMGVAGLVRAWPAPAMKSALRLRTDVVLLIVGSVGALVFLVVEVLVMRAFFSGAPGAGLVPTLAYASVFPLPLLVFAGLQIHKAVKLMPARPLPDRARLRKIQALLLALCLAVIAGRVLAQEAIMLWYGYRLVPAAYASAEAIAGNKPYCLIDEAGADSFEELDLRRILLAAAQKRGGFQGMNPVGKDPHFGIAVDGTVYWWSFRLREFRALPGRGEPFWPVSQQCVAEN